jgi:hypothetical protein
MSASETKTVSLWLVNETAWEYNDEYHYPSEGANPIAVFSDLDAAKKYADSVNLRGWESGISEFVSDYSFNETVFHKYCDENGIFYGEGSGNTWDDFLNGDASGMSEKDIIAVMQRIGLTFCYPGIQIFQVCADVTAEKGGFCAVANPGEEGKIRSILKDRPLSDHVTIEKRSVETCKCDSCGYTNATGSTTCRLCNREIEI